MGVPALFRWLSRKYPKIISSVVEDESDAQYGKFPQYLDPNPNGELDNLYLDMNGIVHPCTHPEHKPPPETEDEMFLDVFKYTDRVLMMARPRKVLVIAVDGVAPRAKMNQQRARRFRAAQEAKIANEESERQIREFENRGQAVDEALKGKKKWDTNVITPGTPFMDGLAVALRYWVAYKLATDPGWADLQVIISDATVPGEGEHKLMSFIRSQRLDPLYNPNTTHCIYGLDADLIFLGLATHEPHFRVLREDVFAQGGGGRLRVADQLRMTAEEKERLDEQDARKPFIWLHVNVLREYLEVELSVRTSFQWDLERALDDWVFMCFFVGNDFLPHMPSLSVRDNGIDILVGCWKLVIGRARDYITCDGKLNLEGVELLLGAMATKEDEVFRKRHEHELRYQHHDKRRNVAREEEKALRKQFLPSVSKGKEKAPVTADVNMPLMDTSGKLVDGYAQLSNKDIVHNRDTITKANMANADAAEALKKLLDLKNSGGSVAEPTEPAAPEQDLKRSASEMESTAPSTTSDDEDDENEDKVRTWEAGYRDRYYKTKFHVQTEEEVNQIRREVTRAYLEGISWALLYYFQGCQSWQWYFPFHYAPFAADFSDIRDAVGEKGIEFSKGEPFRPYEQLMSVLPAASGHTLPVVLRDLMSNPESEIIDFYPEDFQIDMNGAKMSWQGIALLPFINEKRLLAAVQAKYPLLTDAEIERNTNKRAQLFVSSKNKNYKAFVRAFDDDKVVDFKAHTTGLAGVVDKVTMFDPSEQLAFPLSEGDMPDISKATYLQAWYDFPETKPGKSMLLNGYIAHEKVLNEGDKYALTNKTRYNNRFQDSSFNNSYVNRGPSGLETYLAYSMRPGGFRSILVNGPDQGRQSHTGGEYTRGGRGRGNFRGQRGGYNGGGSQRGGYNNSYNPRGHGGYSGGNNGGYNSGYNGGASHGGPNRGQGRGGYNNSGFNQNNGYQNNGYQMNGYLNNHQNNFQGQPGGQNAGFNGGGFNNRQYYNQQQGNSGYNHPQSAPQQFGQGNQTGQFGYQLNQNYQNAGFQQVQGYPANPAQNNGQGPNQGFDNSRRW